MFKTLITLILLFYVTYYLLKAILRLVTIFFPQNFKDNLDNRGHKKEGNITIEYPEKHKKHINKDSGEYIDYEEIK